MFARLFGTKKAINPPSPLPVRYSPDSASAAVAGRVLQAQSEVVDIQASIQQEKTQLERLSIRGKALEAVNELRKEIVVLKRCLQDGSVGLDEKIMKVLSFNELIQNKVLLRLRSYESALNGCMIRLGALRGIQRDDLQHFKKELENCRNEMRRIEIYTQLLNHDEFSEDYLRGLPAKLNEILYTTTSS